MLIVSPTYLPRDHPPNQEQTLAPNVSVACLFLQWCTWQPSPIRSRTVTFNRNTMDAKLREQRSASLLPDLGTTSMYGDLCWALNH